MNAKRMWMHWLMLTFALLALLLVLLWPVSVRAQNPWRDMSVGIESRLQLAGDFRLDDRWSAVQRIRVLFSYPKHEMHLDK